MRHLGYHPKGLKVKEQDDWGIPAGYLLKQYRAVTGKLPAAETLLTAFLRWSTTVRMK